MKKGDPEHSRLIQVIGYGDRVKMPPTGKLSPEQIDDLTAWVSRGAPWPDGPGPPAGESQEGSKAALWSFQPVKDCAPPLVRSDSWIKSPIDRFILSRLEKKGLRPAGGGQTTLLRRVTYDLTGLPPTPADIDAFLAIPPRRPSPASSTVCWLRRVRRKVGPALAGRRPVRRLDRPGRGAPLSHTRIATG